MEALGWEISPVDPLHEPEFERGCKGVIKKMKLSLIALFDTKLAASTSWATSRYARTCPVCKKAPCISGLCVGSLCSDHY
jgi:hypothetical protein